MSVINKILQRLGLSITRIAIIENLFWAVIGKVVTLGTGFLGGVLVAHYLGPKDYGLMNYVLSYVAIFQAIALFGLDNIEVREESRDTQKMDMKVGSAFYLKVFFAILLMLATIITAMMTESDTYTILLIGLYTLSIIFNSFGVIRNFFIAKVENERVVKAEISRSLISLMLKVVLVLIGCPLVWFVFMYMFDNILLASGYILAYRQADMRLHNWRFDKTYARLLIIEAFPLMLTNTAVILYQRIDTVMIGQMIDQESVGHFSVASRFVEMMIYVPIMLAQTITPVLVRIREQDEAAYRDKVQQFLNITVWLSLLMAVLVMMLSGVMVRWTFGVQYLPAVAILQVMAFKAVSVALSNSAGAMLITEGVQKYAIFRDLLGCIVCVVTNYIFLPLYGVMAAAVIAIASNVVAGYLADAIIPAYRHIFVQQTRCILYGWKDMLKIVSFVKERKLH